MRETFEYDVFISHSSRDKPAVLELAERLRDDGLRVWLDEWEIKPGDPISTKVERGLEQSRALILVMSANAFASEWATLERHMVMFRDPTNAQRRFIPLRLDDAEIRDALKQFAYVDWRGKSDQEYAKLLEVCRGSVVEDVAEEEETTSGKVLGEHTGVVYCVTLCQVCHRDPGRPVRHLWISRQYVESVGSGDLGGSNNSKGTYRLVGHVCHRDPRRPVRHLWIRR